MAISNLFAALGKKYQNIPAYVFLCIAGVAVCTTQLSLRNFQRVSAAKSFPDTKLYLSAAEAPLFSAQVWAGPRPAVYPLFARTFRGDTGAIATAQVALSIASWLFLAGCCAWSLTHPVARVFGFTIVATRLLTPGVSLWHKVILSESVAFSLLAVCVGCWLLFAKHRLWYTALAAVLATGLWVGVRDTNAYFALLLGGAFLLYIAVRVLQGPAQALRRQRLPAAVAVLLFAVFAASNLSSNQGQRWLFPFYNNIGQRILTDEARTAWFTARGMPVNAALLERTGKWASADEYAFFKDPALAEFREWSRRHGKSTYIRWLVANPSYTLQASTRALVDIFDTDYAAYAPEGFFPEPTGEITLGKSATVLYAFFAGLLAAFCILPFGRGADSQRAGVVAVPVILLAGLIPCLVVAWHGDAMEINRHAAQTVLQTKIAFVLLVACAADRWLSGGLSGIQSSDPAAQKNIAS